MLQNNWTTRDVLVNVKTLQQLLQEAPLKQPLEWTFPSELEE